MPQISPGERWAAVAGSHRIDRAVTVELCRAEVQLPRSLSGSDNELRKENEDCDQNQKNSYDVFRPRRNDRDPVYVAYLELTISDDDHGCADCTESDCQRGFEKVQDNFALPWRKKILRRP
jgi:hypothetical protein